MQCIGNCIPATNHDSTIYIYIYIYIYMFAAVLYVQFVPVKCVLYLYISGARGGAVVEVLRYKP
jgi:hypothetical protein